MSELPPDVNFLCGSAHRVRILSALDERALDRRDLRSVTGASQPTVSRVLADFEARHWVTRDGHRFRLTELGALVAETLADFADAMTTEQQLRDVWAWLPHDIDGFSIELFSDVVIAQPGPTYPYRPVERFTSLLTDASSLRGFGLAVVKSGNLEPFFDRIAAGLECEYIYPPAVFAELLAWNREVVLDALASGNYTVFVHDDLPIDDRCGICLLDDRTSICCYDPSTGALQSMVDTESAGMYDWATSYYRKLRAEATPIEERDELLAW